MTHTFPDPTVPPLAVFVVIIVLLFGAMINLGAVVFSDVFRPAPSVWPAVAMIALAVVLFGFLVFSGQGAS